MRASGGLRVSSSGAAARSVTLQVSRPVQGNTSPMFAGAPIRASHCQVLLTWPQQRPEIHERRRMSTPTYQTIKLSKGKHSSPDSGACVMELASMLAGEPFTDHPQTVCPVIGSFLRAYNDSIDDERR